MTIPMPDPNAESEISNVIRYERLQNGAFFADFRRDKRLDPEVYHCVIQREGMTDILRWSQHRTLNAAMRTARAELKRLSTKERAQLPNTPVHPG
jgi:hypothetical protein